MACCVVYIFGQVIEFSSVEQYWHIRWNVLTIFGWLEEGVPHNTNYHSKSVKNEILEPRLLEGADHITVVKGGGTLRH